MENTINKITSIILVILFTIGFTNSLVAEIIGDGKEVYAKNTTEEVSTEQPSANTKLNEHEQRISSKCQDIGLSVEETAFVLANANHETGQFKYFEEIDGRNQAIKLGYGGGENWYGRGYIQLTHKANYEKWSDWTGKDLVSNPNLLIEDLDLSASVACSGIKYGSFTGIKSGLNNFGNDWYNARDLINGDKNYTAGCDETGCWTIGTKVKDLTDYYISLF
jgi:predicted chitinase